MAYDFIDRLKLLLKDKNIKQNKFCQDIGITPQSLYEWQNKQSYPNGELILRISRYLNVSCDYLLSGSEFEEKKASNEEIKSALLAIVEKL